MPKNKNKPNAFLYFSLDWKKTAEKKGQKFPNGLRDAMVDPKCNEEWRNLPEESKMYYKTLAKTSKAAPNMDKKTGLGESVSELERAQQREQEYKDNMEEYIKSWVKSAKNRNSVQNLQFYLIHVNYFYYCTTDTGDLEYYPAEIAIAECSLEKGVQSVYCITISEKIRTGYTCDAKENSESTHQIPTDWKLGKGDYAEIFDDICKFIEPGRENKRLPPLYTLFTREDVYCPAKSVLARISGSVDRADDFFLLYSFEDLFRHIHNATIEQTGMKEMDSIIASIELKRDPFAYKLGFECDAHKILQGGVLHCSQSIVQRWFFVLCNFCCDPLEIDMVPGVHMPREKPVNVGKLNSTFGSMSLNDSRRINSTLDLTGVSKDHRQRASERSYRDEQRRKTEANAKPIVIIDHSQINTPKVQERPLRAPHTRSAVTCIVDTTDSESIDLSENSFPSIGRGSVIRRNMQDKKAGQGYAGALKTHSK